MDITHSKNVNSGRLDTGGGSVHLGDNYYKSLEYAELTERREELNDLVAGAATPEKRAKYHASLTRLEAQLEGFRHEVIRLAEQFQEISIDTDRLRTARDHFDHGRFREARAILDAGQLHAEWQELTDQRARLETQLTTNRQLLRSKASEFLILAQLTALDLTDPDRYEKAVRHFETSLEADRHPGNLLAYANFLATHYDLAAAEARYGEILGLAEEMDPPRTATVLNNLAIVRLNRGAYQQAEGHLREVLEIYRPLLQLDPATFRPLVAKAHNNLSVLYRSTGRLPEAATECLLALKVYEGESGAAPGAFEAETATVLNNLGTIQRQRKDHAASLDYHGRALAIRRRMAEQDPDRHGYELSASLSDLATLYLKTGKYPEAEHHYLESLAILRRLLEKNPRQYRPHLGGLLHNLGILYARSGRPEEADRCSHDALEEARFLVRVDPQAHSDGLASALSARAAFLFDRGEYTASAVYCTEALTYYDPLEAAQPGRYSEVTATTRACLREATARSRVGRP